MCGRFTLSDPDNIKEHFECSLDQPNFDGRYNACPGELLPVLTENHPRKIQFFHWGFEQPWAPGPSKLLINGRAETVDTKKTFRESFQKRRCLVLADGFYEWKKIGRLRVPYFFFIDHRLPFGFAGLWKKDKDGSPSFVLLTVEANETVQEVHHRMPLILKPQWEKDWLNPQSPVELCKSFFKPYPSQEMKCYRVSTRVNSSALDEASLLDPVREDPTDDVQGKLF